MSHPYSGSDAFDRIMLLIATFTKYPGVGHINCLDSDSDGEHDSITEVQIYSAKTADELGVNLPAYSRHTVQSDLKTLRRYGILESRRYRWGYHLGTGVVNNAELRTVFNAIASQAKSQNEPATVHLYGKLARRLRGIDAKHKMLYPVRNQLGRTIVHTDPAEMMEKQRYRDTLFEKVAQIEEAILEGQPIEIFRSKSPYELGKTRYEKVFPLQLVYSNIAWYLLQEDYSNGHIVTSRLDRFSGYLKYIEPKGRGSDRQWRQLRIAHQLIERG